MAEKHSHQNPCFQGQLFNYLQPEQREFVKPILRVLKKPAQEELCCALLDYLEDGRNEPPCNFTLEALYRFLIKNGEPKSGDPDDRRFLFPLNKRSPKPIGDIIQRMFGPSIPQK